MTSPEDMKALVVPVWAELMEMELTPAARQVAWTILSWSLRIGRVATRSFTYQDLERRTGIGHVNACRAMKELKGNQIIRRCGDGWQVVPESQVHVWRCRRRLVDESLQLVARRVDAAQGVPDAMVDLPTMEEPRLDVAMAEVAVEAARGKGQGESGEREVRMAESAGAASGKIVDLKSQDSTGGEGGGGTGGGARFFLPAAGIEVKPSAPAVPIKEFSPHLSRGPFTTINHSIGEPTVSLRYQATLAQAGETEAPGEMGSVVPEDPGSIDEETLMKRLRELLGKKIMTSREGARLRLFIRGSRDAADSPDTAEAMRKAINETFAAQREGKIKKSVLGYLRGQAFQFAGQMGWRFEAATMKWVKGKEFNNWQTRQALRRAVAAGA